MVHLYKKWYTFIKSGKPLLKVVHLYYKWYTFIKSGISIKSVIPIIKVENGILHLMVLNGILSGIPILKVVYLRNTTSWPRHWGCPCTPGRSAPRGSLSEIKKGKTLKLHSDPSPLSPIDIWKKSFKTIFGFIMIWRKNGKRKKRE